MLSNNVTAALIAGGKSKRFGSQKTFALYNEKQLLHYATELAFSISHDVIIIGKLTSIDLQTRLKVYQDIYTGCGPLCGIHAALTYAQKDYIAVLPVDMPLLSVNVYRYLYPSSNPYKPVVAVSHKGVEPLVSIWPKSILADFERAIENKEYKLHRMLKTFEAVEVDLKTIMPDYEEEWFKNINYRKDLKEIEEKYNLLHRHGNLKGFKAG